ncbi:TFIIA-alpha and beta-like factor isoform X3 [Pelodiscus sinensis]|uniref:TFIIA-alpha and beta-like factor isoform X3 n=1 Tax=Pelodiscus sinensis TaxID=13735 RepID=UPI003F6B8654
MQRCAGATVGWPGSISGSDKRLRVTPCHNTAATIRHSSWCSSKWGPALGLCVPSAKGSRVLSGGGCAGCQPPHRAGAAPCALVESRRYSQPGLGPAACGSVAMGTAEGGREQLPRALHAELYFSGGEGGDASLGGASMAHANPVPKLYRSIIEDVIEGVRELFAEEGVEEQVLKDLKQVWEAKVTQSKATEGFFKHSHHSPQFTLQLPHNLHRALQTSTASLVIPAGRGIHQFTTADLGASQTGATLTLPSGIAYPIHVPAGVTLQTASGHLYKVNMPVMVTHAPGGTSILQHPLQQIFQQLGQPSVLQASIATVANVNASSVQATAERLSSQEALLQNPTVFQQREVEGKHLENSANPIVLQEHTRRQQQVTSNTMFNHQADSAEKSQYTNLQTAVFTSSDGDSTTEPVAKNSFGITVQDQLSTEPQDSVQQQVSDDIIEMIILGNDLDANALLKEQDSISITEEMESTIQMESDLHTEKDTCSDIDGIIQLDGTDDVFPKEEVENTRDAEENEFIGIIDAEDLKVLEEEEDGDSISNSESGSSSSDTEEPQIDIIEEDPLNSGDDVSEQDTPDLFDTDNVVVCQYDKGCCNREGETKGPWSSNFVKVDRSGSSTFCRPPCLSSSC